MPTELSVERHLDGLSTALTAFVRYADRAGLSAPVPTCPDWAVLDLIAHQGMVHRWAAALLRGERPTDPERWEKEGLAAVDPLGWLRAGAAALRQTVAQAPDDVRALVFLDDAPPPRAFWARRQCHETTIHAVDAMSAALGRVPATADADWIAPDLAEDGIDELLAGFLTRPRHPLRIDEEALLVVVPDDASTWWEVALGPHPPVTTRRRGPVSDADWELTGSSVELYLRLWNRGEPPDLPGGDWRHLAAVHWS
jgi:uncharacterized protein (TIGR03083 family)